ncbi:MAG TPA: type II secretion system major pseudopilin GspG [Planctomycetota bacterium]|nr:type II secretion system major pseudopilin GspG [Planctomycetota bacterium]
MIEHKRPAGFRKPRRGGLGLVLSQRRRARVEGFTLIELLVVIVILGILATLYITQVVPRGDKARYDLTGVQMTNVISAMDQFKLDIGRYPDALEDLIVAPSSLPDPRKYQPGGYLKELPTDGWGNKFIYRRNSSTKGFELISYGMDGKEGGDGYDADIVK